MRRKCLACLCRTCIKSCKCRGCKGKIKECKRYSGFRQLSIFETPEPKYQKAPRHPWSYYGITKERYKQLTEYIQSDRYASLASQAAHRANEMLSSYIILSIEKNLSYEGMQRLWELREIERMSCGRSDFYGWRRYFYSIFDKEIRRIEECGKN